MKHMLATRTKAVLNLHLCRGQRSAMFFLMATRRLPSSNTMSRRGSVPAKEGRTLPEVSNNPSSFLSGHNHITAHSKYISSAVLGEM